MTRPRSRRALLHTGALAVGSLAGCLDGLGDSSTERPATASETEPPSGTAATSSEPETPASETETETTEAPAVELAPVGVQSSFFYLATPDTMAVATPEGTQFAFVEVRPQTDSPPPSDFSLVADGRRFWGTLAPGEVGSPHRLSELGSSYRSGRSDSGWVAFEVPEPLDAEEISLTYRGRAWSLADGLVADLRDPPADFELVSFDAPEQVARDESFEMSLTVENSGAGDGVFRVSLNQTSPSVVPHRATLSVPAGERRDWSWSLGEYASQETESLDFRLESAAARRETTVEIVDASSASQE